MEGKKLYAFKKNCKKLQECCHNTVNRILELMTKHPEHCNDLCNYVKECLVMDKLCDYLCSCCCNSDNISNNMMKEYKDKCSSMEKICKKLLKHMPKKECKYIRCEEMVKLCK